MYNIFHWIFMIFYIQWIQVFNQIHTICTSIVHNFSFNSHDLVRSSIFHWDFAICTSDDFEYFYKSEWSVRLMYNTLHWIFMILYIQRIQNFKQIHNIYTSNVVPLNFLDFLLSMKSNFSTSLDYLCILCTQFTIEFSWFGMFIDLPLNFHEFVHSMNSNFLQIRTICMSIVQNFPLNFHDFVHPTNSNF